MKKMRNQKGFTLVEIAIVLVIVGLLIGGILKGQEMIKSGKVKRAGKQIEDLRAAITSYQDKYRGIMPGSGVAPATAGATAVFTDLAAAGLLAYDTTAGMVNPFGGAVTATNPGGQISIISNDIPDYAARKIDIALDDATATTGDITTAAAYASDDATEDTTPIDLTIVVK